MKTAARVGLCIEVDGARQVGIFQSCSHRGQSGKQSAIVARLSNQICCGIWMGGRRSDKNGSEYIHLVNHPPNSFDKLRLKPRRTSGQRKANQNLGRKGEPSRRQGAVMMIGNPLAKLPLKFQCLGGSCRMGFPAARDLPRCLLPSAIFQRPRGG